MSKFRILVADDHEVVRQGVCALLADHDGWELCGVAVDGREAVQQARKLNPDLVILDLYMPNLNGIEAARQILQDGLSKRILILTVDQSEHIVHELLRIGVTGYILKSDAATDLVAAIEAMQNNRNFFNSRFDDMILNGYLNCTSYLGHDAGWGLYSLTSRERQVLQLIAQGKTTKEAALQLGIGIKTAETYRNNINHKLNVHSTSELILYAIRNHVAGLPAETSQHERDDPV
jgi:DNA-binding NarL/FixJ family response regulator